MDTLQLPSSLFTAGLVHAKQKPIQRHPTECPVSPEISCIIAVNHFNIGGFGEDVKFAVGK